MAFRELAVVIAIGVVGGRLAYVSYNARGLAHQAASSGSTRGHLWSLGALGVAAALSLVFG